MLGLGISLVHGSTPISAADIIASAFALRVNADGGVVENYACLNLDVKDLITEPAPFTTGLLEFYPGAAAAYSLRQLRRSVFPYAIRVRKSDNTEQDIGFNSNGELDTNALLAFADGGDAWVATWYDQSSNGNDATQGTPDAQPQIVSSGSLITENGKPALEFNGVSSYMEAADVTTTQPTTFSLVATHDASTVYYFDGNDVIYRQAAFNSGGYYSAYAGSTQGSGLSYVDGLQVNMFGLFNGAAGALYANAAGSEPKDMGTNTLSGLDIGQRYNNTQRMVGRFQELIFWNADRSDSRTTIQTNVNDFYRIYS